MKNWHEFNPWRDKAVYVPVEEMAEALSGYLFTSLSGEIVMATTEQILETWRANNSLLDAYILPGTAGDFSVGVKYGPEPADYISPSIHDIGSIAALYNQYAPPSKNTSVRM